MGNETVSRKGISLYLEHDELRVIRAALRFAQVSPERPLTFDQDNSAGALVATITVALDKF